MKAPFPKPNIPRQRIREIVWLIALGLLIVSRSAILFFTSVTLQGITDGPGEPAPRVLKYGIPVDSLTVVTEIIRPGQSLGGLLQSYNLDGPTIHAIVNKANEVMEVRKIRAGNTYSFILSNDSIPRPLYFVYENSAVSYTLFDLRDSISVKKIQKEIELVSDTVQRTIKSSLWVALSGEPLGPDIALALEDIYGWSIDFFGLQKGDRFAALYTRQVCDGQTIGLDRVSTAVFTQGERQVRAFYYEPDSTGEYDGYYDEKGQSLKRAFLKAPLKYSRISSRFSGSRYHPVLKIYRPHHGVDYAAPSGTPVYTIGDGVVLSAAYSGQGGHTVKIRHNSLYTSLYLHLKGYAKGIKSGVRVKQGQVIGYVGSTGLSTGPHLDFRVYKAGKPINPLTMESPPVQPLPGKFMDHYLLLVATESARLGAAMNPKPETEEKTN
jgi:murein DD-endopeptidase MepM/ murein hydrolase activator NlpD